jgi:hypothetical protein
MADQRTIALASDDALRIVYIEASDITPLTP